MKMFRKVKIQYQAVVAVRSDKQFTSEDIDNIYAAFEDALAFDDMLVGVSTIAITNFEEDSDK